MGISSVKSVINPGVFVKSGPGGIYVPKKTFKAVINPGVFVKSGPGGYISPEVTGGGGSAGTTETATAATGFSLSSIPAIVWIGLAAVVGFFVLKGSNGGKGLIPKNFKLG